MLEFVARLAALADVARRQQHVAAAAGVRAHADEVHRVVVGELPAGHEQRDEEEVGLVRIGGLDIAEPRVEILQVLQVLPQAVRRRKPLVVLGDGGVGDELVVDEDFHGLPF